MAIEKVVNIQVQENGFDSVSAKVNKLEQSIENLEEQNESLRKSFSSSGKSVLDNGGAMGLLNDATGGLAMTIKDAVEASDLFTKSTKAKTIAQKIYTTVVGTSTGGLKLFRLALIGTGIGAIVIALGLLIANFDKVQKVVQGAIAKFKGMGENAKLLISILFPIVGVIRLITAGLEEMGVIDDDATKQAKINAEKRIKFLDNQKGKLTEKYDTEIRMAKAAGKSTEELEQAKRRAILQTMLALNEAEKVRVKSGDATEEDIKKWNDRQKEIKKVVEDIKVAEIEAETEKQEKIKEANDKANEKRKADNEKRLNDEKARLDNIKKLNENYTKQIEDFNAKTEEEKLKLEKQRAEKELSNLNATEEQKKKAREFFKLKEQELEQKSNETIANIVADYKDKLKELNAVTFEETNELENARLKKEEDAKIKELEILKASEEEKQAVRDFYAKKRENNLKSNQENINTIVFEYEEKNKELNAVTEEQKFELEQQKLEQEEDKKIKELEKLGATQEEIKAIEDYYANLREQNETERAQRLLEAKQKERDAQFQLARDTGDALSNLTNLLDGKSKRSQQLQKGIALAQIAVDTAQAISNAIPASIKAGAEAGKVAGPAAPVVTPAVTASTYIGLASMIASNALRAKSILKGGNESSAASGGGASTTGSTPTQPPSFNIVAGTGSNQIAQGLASQTQPLQAFVVGSAVTSQQELDRNVVSTARL
jgi:hypothetical protein